MTYHRPLNNLRGLTLIEVLVVIAIIGILAAVISVNAVQSGKISRDAKRQADLRMLQSAVELYKNKEGRYPRQCVTDAAAQGWSGQLGTDYVCSDGSSQYIIGLAPKYIPVLPQDPKINGTNSGYVYRTNVDVESESVDYYHEFKSCDIIPAPGGGAWTNRDIDIAGWCRRATLAALESSGSESQNGPIPQCLRSTNGSLKNRFDTSYGVWGGFAGELKNPPGGDELEKKIQRVRDTTRVICK